MYDTCRGVLGDRSLGEPWGGSVLDSVIGAYLTQVCPRCPNHERAHHFGAISASPVLKSHCMANRLLP